MRRALLVAAALAALPSCGPGVPDFSGTWRMTETDRECKHEYSHCFVLIQQRGDRATLHAWGAGDDWSCEGRGSVEGGRLKFRWEGTKKNWRGTSELERSGNELRGTYQRDEAGAALQYCKGLLESPAR